MTFMLDAMEAEHLESQGKYQVAVDLYNKLISTPSQMGEQAKHPIYLSLGRLYRELERF